MKKELGDRHLKLSKFVLCWGLVLAAATVTPTVQGWQSLPEYEFKEGPINGVSQDVGALIRLQWDGRTIELKRDWPQFDEEEIREDHLQELVKRGVDRDRAERIFNMRHLAGRGGKSPLS